MHHRHHRFLKPSPIHYEIEMEVIGEKCKKFIADTAEITGTIPDWNYVIGVLLGYLQGANLGPGIDLTEAGVTGLAVGWNYADAIAGLISATQLLLDKSNYQQIQNKIKASIMIFSSAQMFAFSYAPWLSTLGVAGLTSATALAGPAFALATLIDLSIAAVDFHYAAKEVNFDGWLNERTKEWNHLQKQIADEQNKLLDISNNKGDLNLQAMLEKTHPSKHQYKMDQLDKQKARADKKLEELQDKKDKLFRDIETRCWANKNHRDDISKQLGKMDGIDDYQPTKMDNSIPKPENFKKFFIKKENYVLTPTEHQNCERRDIELQNAAIKNYNKKLELLSCKSLSFIGCTLLAIAPFTGPGAPALFAAGAIICGAVAAYYIYNQRGAIKNKIEILTQAIQNKFEKTLNQPPTPSLNALQP